MAISEACTNVVVHAYEDDDGVLEVEMAASETGLTIRVRDHGSGIRPRGERRGEAPALGLGLPLIAALSDSYELTGTAGRGTEVRMTFDYARDGDPVEENPVPGTVGDDGRWDPDASRETPAG
jgi:anti-sigma regulatory factor (Ser/Thr protein kinase)